MALRLLTFAGVVTFALSADSTWTIIAQDVGTIATGVAFTSGLIGYLPLDANGVGTEIQTSTDGGKTWGGDAAEPFALLLLDIAAYGKNVAVVGALSMEFSNDNGATFNESLNQPGAGQCIRNIGPKGAEIGFAAVGQWGLLTEANGVETSYDAGATFTAHNISEAIADARYGAFPSDKTWFVAAGDWPGEGSDDDPQCDDPPCAQTEGRRTGRKAGEHPTSPKPVGSAVDPSHYTFESAVPRGSTFVRAQSSRIHLLKEPTTAGKLRWAKVKAARVLEANAPSAAALRTGNTTTWEAQIAKTTDAGKTWSIVFSKMGQFYFNGIECTTEQQCCAVSECDSGTFIFCTSDGGSSWTETLIDNDPESSLTDVAALSDTEFWAVGGEFAWYGPMTPHFYHTVDGGATWDLPNITMALEYAIAIDCVAGVNCWANLLDIATQESSIAALH